MKIIYKISENVGNRKGGVSIMRRLRVLEEGILEVDYQISHRNRFFICLSEDNRLILPPEGSEKEYHVLIDGEWKRISYKVFDAYVGKKIRCCCEDKWNFDMNKPLVYMKEEPEKYLFLDVDGVCNNETYNKLWREHGLDKYYHFFQSSSVDPHNIIVLKELVTQYLPGIRIVISSDWRYNVASLNELKKAFVQFGVPLWVDITPLSSRFDRFCREKEILQYIKEHDIEKEQIAILDDINFFDELSDRFVQTDYRDGFTHKDKDKVARMF